eukprot:SAG25_NODE_1161_length_3726_cov_1.685777_3_plen_271_part_00
MTSHDPDMNGQNPGSLLTCDIDKLPYSLSIFDGDVTPGKLAAGGCDAATLCGADFDDYLVMPLSPFPRNSEHHFDMDDEELTHKPKPIRQLIAEVTLESAHYYCAGTLSSRPENQTPDTVGYNRHDPVEYGQHHGAVYAASVIMMEQYHNHEIVEGIIVPTLDEELLGERQHAGTRKVGPRIRRPRKRHKKRVIKKDPTKPRPPPWSQQELRCFRQFVNSIPGGPEQIGWLAVAKALGTNRSKKSLHTRWLRDQGRIVDGPRGGSAISRK